MTPEMQKILMDRLDVLAAKFGTDLWPILVKQQFTNGVMNLLIGLVTLAVLGVGLKYLLGFLLRKEKKYDQLDYVHDSDTIGFSLAGITILVLIMLAFSATCIFEGVGQLVAPEASALKMLLGSK